MEVHIKERLVGAGILVTLIVLLVPELLSGSRQPTPPPELPAVATPGTVRTYTIDLSAPDVDIAEPPAETPDEPEQADQPKQSEPNQAAAAIATVPTAAVPTIPVQPAPSQSDSAARPSSPPKPSQPAALKAPSKLASTAAAEPRSTPAAPVAPETSGWAVQLGSFSNRENAERLTQKLNAEGYKAFVSRTGSGAKTRHRVRVGPEQERIRAQDLAQRLKRAGHPVSVVPHP